MTRSKIKPIIRCIHRHTISEHPNCFARGDIKYDFKNDREFERVVGIPWYKFPGYKIGYLDIETDGLKADFGTMLTWAIKEKDGDVVTDVVFKKELFDGLSDRRIVRSILEEIRKYRIIVTYYGTGFDLPFIRTKALRYGLDFPGFGEVYHWDMYYTVRSKLCLSRKSLDNVCDYLGISGKTRIDKNVWRRAKYGDPKALKEVLEHNVPDVVILETLHNKLTPFRKWIRTST